ncbi:HEPN domain-containing protein [Streptomonospora algeriensis]|uniref:HEPN domain-containing protein n=1 Tax=Streptomonospora algeriensis TaxID=995084 RepID=A0ABW3BIM8_9ACTN
MAANSDPDPVARAVGQAHRELLSEAVPDVRKLLEFHEQATGTGRGRRELPIQVVSRSAVVLTCAYWEAFCENLAAEALRHLADHASEGNALPKELKKSLAKKLEGEQDELAVWSLAGDGWKSVLRDRAKLLVSEDDRTLNTPKSEPVEQFFRENVGLASITASWKWSKTSSGDAAKRLNKFVVLRGSIAHRGAPKGGVKKEQATNGLELIQRLAEKSATAVSDFLNEHSGAGLPELEVT